MAAGGALSRAGTRQGAGEAIPGGEVRSPEVEEEAASSSGAGAGTIRDGRRPSSRAKRRKACVSPTVSRSPSAIGVSASTRSPFR